jgi:N-acetylmuramic acid 6-phosphate etherase
MSKKVFDEIASLVTEQVHKHTEQIDTADVRKILTLINQEDQTVATAVQQEIPYIAEAVEIIVSALKKGGRLFYVGAGTSGRLGILDAAELPPTFGINPEMVQGIIAGGYETLIRSREGVEDDQEAGREALVTRRVTSRDVVFGLSASGRTPFVLGALAQAQEFGAKTIYLSCNPRQRLSVAVDVAICPVTGPEVIMGSTRMKAGTAQKLILNMVSTAVMIKMGKVYKNLMVDLQATSVKLQERSKKVIMFSTGLSYEEASELLARAHGWVKAALVMFFCQIDYEDALERLQRSDGWVQYALQDSTLRVKHDSNLP